MRDLERGGPPRRVRRRRQASTPWQQRNALSIAAVSFLVALLGLGFGLLQTFNNNHAEANPSLLAIGQNNEPSTTNAGLVGNGVLNTSNAGQSAPTVEARREIESTARVLDPSYTVESGDTLGRIAVRFGTSVERIQALNNLADPKTLRIGAKLVIPPPL